MNTTPDHDQPRFGDFGSDMPAPQASPERLSLMALFSTITGGLTLVGCCVPGVGLLPVLLGIGGFIGISRSRGTVRGKGLAIVGFALGVISLLLSTAIWIGISSGAARFGPVYSQAFDPDPDVVRTVLTSSAAADLTDEQVEAFQSALAAEGITTVTIPRGLKQLWDGYRQAGNTMQGLEKLRDPSEGTIFPLPAETDTGLVMIVVLMDPNQALGSGLPGLVDAGVWTSSGQVIWLFAPTPAAPDAATDDADQSPPPDRTDTEGESSADDSPAEDPDS